MASCSITPCQTGGEMWKQCHISFSWAPNLMWKMTAATILNMFAPWKNSYDKSRHCAAKAEASLCQQRSLQSKIFFFQQLCMDMRVGPGRRLSAEELMLLNCGVGENS